MSSIHKAVSQTYHLRNNVSDNQRESTMHKHGEQLSEKQAAYADSMETNRTERFRKSANQA